MADSELMRVKPEHEPVPERALSVSVLGMTKRFGSFAALADVSFRAFSLPEEPLRNACVPGMSVAQNMALRNYDRAPLAAGP